MEHSKKSKEWRKENKIRKLAALVEITELNARDRMNSTTENPSADMQSDEPIRKKLKLNDGSCPSDDTQQAASEPVTEGKRKFSAEEYAELKAALKERSKQLKKIPSLNLKDPGLEAKLDIPPANRVPLFLADIQSLILNSFLKNASPLIPRWCHFENSSQLSSVRILLIEGAGISDYVLAQDKLPALADTFYPFNFEVVMPSAYCGNLIEELCGVPMPRNEYLRLVKAHGSFKRALNSPSSGIFRILRAFFPVQHQSETPDDSNTAKNGEASSVAEIQPPDKTVSEPPSNEQEAIVSNGESSKKKKKKRQLKDEENNPSSEPSPSDNTEAELVPPGEQKISTDNSEPLVLHPSDKFPRTALLLSAWQMVEEGYPLLINSEMKEKYKDFVFSKSKYTEVTSLSPMYGLDCEMCVTCVGKSEVTRVAIVNEKHETVLDTLVLPYNRITNYVTKYSGITAKMMKGVTTRLEDVQDFIRDRLEPDAILVGQSLQFDLKALKIIHPYNIDTSVILNVTGDRYRKSKLSRLTEIFLSEQIQTGNDGHSPVEDSLASLKLVQLKLSHSIEFGDEVLINQGKEMAEKWPAKPEVQLHKKMPKVKEDISGYATSLFGFVSRTGKHATIVSTPDVLEKYVDYLDPTTTTYEGHGSTESEEGASEGSSKSSGVTCTIADSNKSVIEKATTNASSSFITVGHIRLATNESDALALREEEVLNRINHYAKQMQDSAPLNSLSLVVLCGREKSSNGVCFMNLKKTTYQRLNFQPNSTS